MLARRWRRVRTGVGLPGRPKRRRRRLLATTVMLETPIATAASAGLSRPVIASGIAIRL